MGACLVHSRVNLAVCDRATLLKVLAQCVRHSQTNTHGPLLAKTVITRDPTMPISHDHFKSSVCNITRWAAYANTEFFRLARNASIMLYSTIDPPYPLHNTPQQTGSINHNLKTPAMWQAEKSVFHLNTLTAKLKTRPAQQADMTRSGELESTYLEDFTQGRFDRLVASLEPVTDLLRPDEIIRDSFLAPADGRLALHIAQVV